MSSFGKGMECGVPLSEPCFDFERCRNGSSAGIYVYDGICTLANSSILLASQETDLDRWTQESDNLDSVLRSEVEGAGLLAQTYESACLFVAATSRYTPCAVEQPLWNDGTNHVMVSLGDVGRLDGFVPIEEGSPGLILSPAEPGMRIPSCCCIGSSSLLRDRRPEIADSYAMEAASNLRTCFYRAGYDISVPLSPKHVFPALAAIPPSDRQFFLTTKGSVYLSSGGSEERMSVVPLHDEESGVIMSLHCFEMHGEHLLPENVEYCKSLKDRYDDHDYGSLMNTTFGLVPSGRSPGTFRLGEVMSAGAIPVFVGRELVLPFREEFDWPSFSFVFTPDQVGPHMIETLQEVSRAEREEMQRKSLEVYREMFGTDTRNFRPTAKRIVDILRKRFGQQIRL
ncbi:unnamed protein product [Pylaiella littoralis]